jgi:glycosyltransferase involved in cell wall biosynthesis
MNYFGMFGSPWLKALMAERYGFNGVSFRYGYDPERYCHLPEIVREPDRVAVYIRPRTVRRGFELVLGAVSALCSLRPQTRITLFGAAEEIRNLHFACEQAGILDDRGLCRLYNRATAVMLTSLTNYSIIPVEAMACGAAIVDVRAPSIQSVFDDGVHLALSDADPLAMARVAARVLDDAPARNLLIRQAGELIRGMRWDSVRATLAEQLIDVFHA